MSTVHHLYDLLIFGGRHDPSITALINAAEERNISLLKVLHDEDTEPEINWDYQSGSFIINGQICNVNSSFLRYDVFSKPAKTPSQLDRGFGWYTTIMGACLVSNTIYTPNKFMDHRTGHKSFNLACAKGFGIPIPDTHITNSQTVFSHFCEDKNRVIKPVAGGSYCISADTAIESTEWHDGKAPMPAFVQECLSYPEYRIFRYGDHFMTFEIDSDHLDYRAFKENSMFRVPNEKIGEDTLKKLKDMTDRLGVDFFACDFKTRQSTGEVVFLEMNTGPMFVGYDICVDGELINGMLDWLTSQTATKSNVA